jgi:DNA-binding XRE family transcriptional regulator
VTQEELAKYLNCSKQTISNWENSKTYPSFFLDLMTLCNLFNTTPNNLIKKGGVCMKNTNKKIYIYSFIFIVSLISFFVSISYVKFHGVVMLYPALISIIILLFSGWQLDKFKEDKDLKNFKEIIKYLEKIKNK